MANLRGRWVLAVVLAMAAAACSGADPSTSGAPSPGAPESTPTSTPAAIPRATLTLHLFRNGEITRVVDGDNQVVARWPSRIAPYQPPIQTKHGFIGLANMRRHLDLWLVDEEGRNRIDRNVSQGFAVSAGGKKVAYGLPRYKLGGYTTRLIMRATAGNRPLGAVTIANYAEPIGFVGDRVLISVGDGLARAAVWDPATNELHSLKRYGSGGTTDPTARRAILYEGDGPCWLIASWADTFTRKRGPACNFYHPAFSPSGRWVAGLRQPKSPSGNRLEVYESLDATSTFRSLPLPGGAQTAWESEESALVLARATNTHVIHRCRVGRRSKGCRPVWSGDGGGRYSTWLIPRAPRPMDRVRDRDRGFAIWPEHRGADARSACVTPAEWRTDPRETAEEFGRRVLDWPNAAAEIDRYEHQGIGTLVHRSDGPVIRVWLRQARADCWMVAGVARALDHRPEGVSAKVRGRNVTVGSLRLGAKSADVIVGFNGQTVEKRLVGRSRTTLRLDFEPKGSGFFIILLRDSTGSVFSAAGALLYPGLVAG